LGAILFYDPKEVTEQGSTLETCEEVDGAFQWHSQKCIAILYLHLFKHQGVYGAALAKHVYSCS